MSVTALQFGHIRAQMPPPLVKPVDSIPYSISEMEKTRRISSGFLSKGEGGLRKGKGRYTTPRDVLQRQPIYKAVCWATIPPASLWILMPMLPLSPNAKRPIRWAASSPLLFKPLPAFPHMGHGLGQGKGRHRNPAKR